MSFDFTEFSKFVNNEKAWLDKRFKVKKNVKTTFSFKWE